jgi:hypothetical protein
MSIAHVHILMDSIWCTSFMNKEVPIFNGQNYKWSQIWYNVSTQYNMLYSSINMHANIIQNCSNVVCNEGTLKALTQWSRP